MFDVYNTCLMYIIVQLYIRSTSKVALVTHLSEMDASYGRLEQLVDHLHCMLAAIQSLRTLSHS